MIKNILEKVRDLFIPFSECRVCKYKRNCDHKVWINRSEIEDCNYEIVDKERMSRIRRM